MDPIEISSSDWDLDDSADDDTGVTSPVWESHPVNTRILPSWPGTPDTHSRSRDYGEQSHGASNVDHLRQSRYNFSHNSSGSVGAPDGKLSVEDESHFPLMTENMGQSSNSVVGPFFNEAYNTIDLNVSGKNLRKVLSQKASKRTLPPSILRSSSHINSNSLLENLGSSQVHNALGISSHSAGTSSTNHKNYMKDHNRRDGDDGITVLNNSGSRTLPPSLMYGKSIPTSQFVSSSDIVYRSRINEESADEHDERLVFQAALEDLHQPKLEADLPDGLLTVPLFRHQKIALAWMLQKETKSTHCLGGILADDQGLGKTVSMIALIQMQRALQSNSKAENQCNHKTEALNLDDDDDNCESGLDKSKQSSTSEDVKVTPVSTSVRALPRRPTAGTLVVCPATVLRQWAGELNYKVADESKLSVLIYHGSNRTKDPAQLATYDVVLTTYSIVANEVRKGPLVDEDEVDQRDGESVRSSSEFSYNKKRNRTSNGAKTGKRGRKRNDTPFDSDSGALARVVWYRVILDEAQTIKNHRTQMARACCGLRAKRRWCLSGTPIQNAIDDLYSYFRFLKCEPYCVYKSFCNSIKNFIARNSVSGYKKLQAILTPIMLRRTKDTLIDGKPIINLPPKSVCLTKVDFSVEERAFYLKLEAESRSKFKAYAAAGTVSQNYANILLMLLRLRQACDHPLLVKGFNSESVGKVSVDMAKKLPKEMLTNLLDLLETSLAICCLCNDPPEDAVVTMCGHVFCYQCVSLFLTGDENVCPAPECKELLGADIVFSGATLRSICDDPGSISSNSSQSDENSLVQHNECSSSKIGAALKILQLNCKSKGSTLDLHESMACSGNNKMGDATLENEGPGKAIIFSQWTTMLDLVEISLRQADIQYRRLDGTMSLAARDKAVKDFNADPEVTVMLMSLKAGNLGLNMVAASHVILLDLWWNPTTEDQAIDRAHRIGQTRPVTVSRITVKDTVEDRILALQEEKRKLVASAFGEDQSGGSAARLTVEDLKYLFMAQR